MSDAKKFQVVSGGAAPVDPTPEVVIHPDAPRQLEGGGVYRPPAGVLEMPLGPTSGEIVIVECDEAFARGVAGVAAELGYHGIKATELSVVRRAMILAGVPWSLGSGRFGLDGVLLYRVRASGRWERFARFYDSPNSRLAANLAAAYCQKVLLAGLRPPRQAPLRFEAVTVPGLARRTAAGICFSSSPTVLSGELPEAILDNLGLLIRPLGESRREPSDGAAA